MSQGMAPFGLFQGNAPSYNNTATSSGSSEWVVRSDPSGLPYLYNTVTQRTHNLALNSQRGQSNPLLPEAVSIGFNRLGGSQSYPDAVSDAGQSWTPNAATPWKEYTDNATGSQYWYNEATGERTWDSPIDANKPPPPPTRRPSPPTSPPPRKASTPYMNERDQWSQYTNSAGTAIWYNRVTGNVQKNKPRCMMKYR